MGNMETAETVVKMAKVLIHDRLCLRFAVCVLASFPCLSLPAKRSGAGFPKLGKDLKAWNTCILVNM